MKLRMIALAALAAFTTLASRPAAAADPTTLVTQRLSRTGVTLTAQAFDEANGMRAKLYGGELLVVTNDISATDNLTVTAQDQLQDSSGYTHNAVFAVAPGEVKYVGPFVKRRWADGDGYLQLSMEGGTDGTLGLIRLPIGEPESQTK